MNPQTNPEAPRPAKKSARGWLHVFALALLVVAAANGVIEYGTRDERCTRCAATAKTREFKLLGFGGRWGRRASLGKLAQFIEKHDGPCQHRWVMTFRLCGNLIYRTPELVSSREDMLFEMMNATSMDLESESAKDHAFLGRLKATVRDPYDSKNDPMIRALCHDWLKGAEDVTRRARHDGATQH